MKNIIITLLLIIIAPSCNKLNNCGILFFLGDSEQSTVSCINKNSFSFEYEIDGNNEKVLRVKRIEFQGMEFNTVRLGISDNKIMAIEYRVHGKDNINKVVHYLTDSYGASTLNPQWKENSDVCKMYWGNSNDNFILAIECDENYYKIIFYSSKAKDASLIFGKLVKAEK